MGQQQFRECPYCGDLFVVVRKSGYGPVYCTACRPVVTRLLAKARQARYQRRKRDKRNG